VSMAAAWVQELLPRGVSASLRCREDLQCAEDAADRGRAHPVAELEELTLDPLVSPAAVLGGKPFDKRSDLGAYCRSARPVRVGPFPGDEATVPAEDRAGA